MRPPSSEHASRPSPRPLGAWLELLRPANVATAPADVLAGAAVAAGSFLSPALPWLVAASACLYAGGIVLNDYFDRAIDARERPERPIPGGRVRPSHAATAGAALLALGVGLAAAAGPASALIALGVASAVLIYDVWGKHQRFIGPVNMGLCRALNLVLGMAVAPAAIPGAWPIALVPLVYISAVTMVSRGEVNGSKRPVALAALALVGGVVMALAAIAVRAGADVPASAADFRALHIVWPVVLTAWLARRVIPAFAAAWRDPTPIPIRSAVRTGVLSLVLVDSVIAASYAGIIESLAVLATGLLAWSLARLFAVT